MEWRDIEDEPAEDVLPVLLYYPSVEIPGWVEQGLCDYSVQVGMWCRAKKRYGAGSGWVEQGTNHDPFEEWAVEAEKTPTLWAPLHRPTTQTAKAHIK